MPIENDSLVIADLQIMAVLDLERQLSQRWIRSRTESTQMLPVSAAAEP